MKMVEEKGTTKFVSSLKYNYRSYQIILNAREINWRSGII